MKTTAKLPLVARRAPECQTAAPAPARLAPVAQGMVGRAGLRGGELVLAAAASSQTLADWVVARGAGVAEAQGVPFAWPDETFDAALAFFGVTAHPDPQELADELWRVTCPGASVVLAAWSGQWWARHETAQRHLSAFCDIDLTHHRLPGKALSYSLVFARKPSREPALRNRHRASPGS